ncbi:MAG TPA: M20/M25/M40 family metallo-hydrolase [Firmicutes bacterium]|uniref:M20/M25/M40 family metallo-hydrolase n=1 Tax=Gelria sp. Kuro-4 TaxID=2796927 RepID=UPI0019B4A4F7|nr:M20/M25/M40 family metallo-hydrolase [Gelria sp. Kuro-4]BCV23589.1 peptidase M20 [Gelria sp. Kuro-4]HHV57253.1 M20/M25/M40 family metallo-hydrolase [Bacillota bacterium]
MDLEPVYAYVDAHADALLADLFRLLRQRSISTQDDGVKECAELLATQMREVGIDATVYPTARHPVVYGEIGPAGAPTILVYGHYDVQPPEPLELWQCDPFEPVIRDGKIYARGSSDNKGQLFAHVKGIQAYRAALGELPLKVKFIFEGEEEISSPNLEPFVAAHRNLLRCDVCIFSDSHVQENGRPLVVLGLKGMLYVEITVRGADRDLHSMRAAAVPSPVWRLVHLLAALKGEDGLVRIPGFYDDVRPLLPEEIAAVEAVPCDKAALAADLGVTSLLVNRHGDDYYKNMIFEPTCNISGLTAGYQGPGSKTVLPAQATAKLDLRLVPDQKPERVLELLKEHLARSGYADAEVKPLGFLEPSRTPITHPLVAVARRAVADAYGVEPYVYPGIGGAGPNYIFEKHLGVPCLTIPFAAADQNNHAPNESMIVAGYLNGIKTSAALIEHVAAFFSRQANSSSKE